MPDWAQTACDDYVKRFGPDLRLEVKTVKTEPRGSKSRETLLAAERQRIEAAIPRGARVVAMDERGSTYTTQALAQVAQAQQQDAAAIQQTGQMVNALAQAFDQFATAQVQPPA
jgi:23S rRNA (pseudouridine1915-N3)-methyltransferase